MAETYKGKKIEPVVFGIVSLPNLDYQPPSSCLGPGNTAKGPHYRQEWDESLVKSLIRNFKKQKFLSIKEGRLEELGIKAPLFYSQAENDIMDEGIQEYQSVGGESRPLVYFPSQPGKEMKTWGNLLHEKDSIDFIIALVRPRMTGQVVTTYSAGGAGYGGGTSSSTQYTTDVKFGIWSAVTGELVYASGSIRTSSGFCVFMGPESASINSNNMEMSNQLKILISRFLNRPDSERIEIGQAKLGLP